MSFFHLPALCVAPRRHSAYYASPDFIKKILCRSAQCHFFFCVLIHDLVQLTTVTPSKMKAHCVLDQGNDSEHSKKCIHIRFILRKDLM